MDVRSICYRDWSKVGKYFPATPCFLFYFYYTSNMETKGVLTALAALGHETRLAVFRLLVETGPEGLPVGKIGEHLGTAPATLSFHLKELANADLVTMQHEGRFIYTYCIYRRNLRGGIHLRVR